MTFYDPRNNAIDAANMCFAAQSCVGFNREHLLETALGDMVKAFDPSTGIQLTDQETTFYYRFVTKAKYSLDAIGWAKKKKIQPTDTVPPVKTVLSLSELADEIRDAEIMFRAAEECTGTRRTHLVETARWALTRARDAHERKSVGDLW